MFGYSQDLDEDMLDHLMSNNTESTEFHYGGEINYGLQLETSNTDLIWRLNSNNNEHKTTDVEISGDTNCVVCLAEGETYKCSRCPHNICLNCYDVIIRSNQKKCPTCRLIWQGRKCIDLNYDLEDDVGITFEPLNYDYRIFPNTPMFNETPAFSFIDEPMSGIGISNPESMNFTLNGNTNLIISENTTQINNTLNLGSGFRRNFQRVSENITLNNSHNIIEVIDECSIQLPKCSEDNMGLEYIIIPTSNVYYSLMPYNLDIINFNDRSVRLIIRRIDRITLISNGIDKWYVI